MNLEKIKCYFNQICPIEEEIWEDFAKNLTVIQRKEGEILLRDGQVCNFVGFINSGLVRVYELKEGIEINRTFFMENFFATEYDSFLSQQPSKETLEAVEDTELVLFTYKHLHEMYDKYKSFERLGRLIAERLYVLQRRKVERFLLQSPEQRYLHMLEEHPEYIHRIPHYHIASYLGIKPQSLSRIRSRLEKNKGYSLK